MNQFKRNKGGNLSPYGTTYIISDDGDVRDKEKELLRIQEIENGLYEEKRRNAALERIRKENDPLEGWLDEKGYVSGNSESVALKEAYSEFVDYCQENGHQRPSKKTFSARLRNAGFTVKMPSGHVGTLLFFSFRKNDFRITSRRSPCKYSIGKGV